MKRKMHPCHVINFTTKQDDHDSYIPNRKTPPLLTLHPPKKPNSPVIFIMGQGHTNEYALVKFKSGYTMQSLLDNT